MRQRFEKEHSPIKMICVVKRTAIATGLTVGTAFNIKKYASSRVRINPDSFDRVVIRRVVRGFYLRKEYPTLSKVLGKVKEACSFVVSSAYGVFFGRRVLRTLNETVTVYLQRACTFVIV